MRLTPAEQQRLVIFTAAQFARAALARGLRLSAPEAIALISDEVGWAARSGQDYPAVVAAGRTVLAPDQVLDGVAELLQEIRVEAVFEEGTRLVVVRQPVGSGPDTSFDTTHVWPVATPARAPQRVCRSLAVTNTSRRVVRVSSHYPFHLVNHRLEFDREAAKGYRLDLPAGRFLRWSPGERHMVELVALPYREESAETEKT